MYFDLTDEQQAIKSTAHDFLASRFKSERMREIAASDDGTDPDGWRQMAELGWAGLALPEEWGDRASGSSTSRCSSRRWATRSLPRRCSRTRSPAWR